MQARQ